MEKKIFGLVLILVLALTVACGGGPAGGPGAAGNEAPVAESGGDGVKLAPQLSVYNWADYIDEQILADYEARYGVKIIYDTFASNEDLLTKLQAGASGYDVIFPSDYMVAQMIELGLLAPINAESLPNFANISPSFRNPPYDPGNAHCVPYLWGMTGLAYRRGYPAFESNPPDSWTYLFDKDVMEQIAPDGINVLNDQRELMAAALFYLGLSPNSTERADLEAARDLILQAKPMWKTFNSEDYYSTLMESDEIVLSHAWSGDTAQAYANTYDEEAGAGNWLFAVPKEGAVRYADNVCIPANSQRIETALHFMNYLMDAKVAAAITNFTYYPSANEAAKEFIDPDILNNPGVYPPGDVLDRLHWLTDVGDAIFTYDEMWTVIKGQ